MACLGGSIPSFAAMVVLHHGRASYICILLVIPFLIKLTCVVLRNRLSNVVRDPRKAKRPLTFFTRLTGNKHINRPYLSVQYILKSKKITASDSA
jgi:hypothetical protein